MTYLLDTSICVHWLRGQYNVDKAIDRVGIDNCRISEITAAELLAGAISAGAVLVSENSPRMQRIHGIRLENWISR